MKLDPRRSLTGPKRLPEAPAKPAVATDSAIAPTLATDSFQRTAGAAATASVRDRLAKMTLDQKVKLLVMGYGDTRSAPTTGAIIVNQTHLTATGAPALRQVVAKAGARTGVPVLVAADQEGGLVNRLKKLPETADLKFPSAKEMQSMTIEQIRAEGQKTGAALAKAGVNTLLGPVLDTAAPKTLMDKMNRSFGSTPEQVTERGKAFIEGLRQGNPQLAIVAKHYPGYNAFGNSDIAVVHEKLSAAQVNAHAKAFLAQDGLDGVMVSSLRYDGIDPDTPACFSKTIVGGLRQAKPEVVIMTDDLGATSLMPPGVDKNQQIKENAQKAFLAGADMLLVMDGPRQHLAYEGVKELIQQHPELQAQLDASVARIMKVADRTAAGAKG